MSIHSQTNIGKTQSGSEKLEIHDRVLHSDGRAYLVVTKGDQRFRLSAEGLFDKELQRYHGQGKALSPEQLSTIKEMVNKVFFSSGTPIKSARTLNIKFASDISSKVKEMSAKNSTTIGEGAVHHASFQGEGKHVEAFSTHIAESYYALCRSYGEINDNISTKQDQIQEAKNGIQETAQKGIAQNNGKIRENEERAGGLESELGDLTLQFQDVTDQLEASPSPQLEAKAASLDRQIGDVNGQLETLRSSNESLQSENNVLSEKLADQERDFNEQLALLRSQNEQLTAQNRELGQRADGNDQNLSQLSDLRGQLSQVQDQLKASGEKTAQLSGEKEALQSQIGELQQKAQIGEQDRQELHALKGELANVKGELETSRQETTQLKGERGNLQNQIEDLQIRVQDLQSSGSDDEKKLSDLRSEMRQLKDELSSSQGELQKTQGDLGKTEGNLEKMQGELGKAQGDLRSTQQLLGKAQEDLGHVRGELEKSQSDLSKTQGDLGATRDEMGQLQQELGTTRGERDLALREKGEIGGQQSESLAKIGELERQIETKNQELSGLKADRDTAKLGMEEMRGALIEQRDTAQKEVRELRAESKKQEGEIGQLKTKGHELEQRLTEKMGNLDQLQSKKTQLEKELKDQAELNGQLRNAVSELQSSDAAISKDRNELKMKAEKLQEQVLASNDKIRSAESTIGQLESKISEVRDEAHALRGENDKLENNIRQMEQKAFLSSEIIKNLNSKKEGLEEMIAHDPSISTELRGMVDEMKKKDLLFLNNLSSNDILYNSAAIPTPILLKTTTDIASRKTLTPQDISTFTTAALCLEAQSDLSWRAKLRENPELLQKVPPQLQALAEDLQPGIKLDLTQSKQSIDQLQKIFENIAPTEREIKTATSIVENTMRSLIRQTLGNSGIDKPPLDLSRLSEQILDHNSLYSKVLETFDPKVKEQLCIMAYYQSVVQSGGRRAGKALSTHDQWKFLYDRGSSASTLFEPKAENLLHLVDTLNQTRLKGSTLSSDQMNQVNDIFSMMNGNRPSSNMFAPTGFGKTAIVELTMALTNKIAAKAPQFYYVSSIPSTVENVKSVLFGDLDIKEENGVYKMNIKDESKTDRRIVFIDEAHRISSASEIYINGKPAQNVRITATPSMRTSLLSEQGAQMVGQVQQFGTRYSKAFESQAIQQVQKERLETLRQKLSSQLSHLDPASIRNLEQKRDECVRNQEMIKNNIISEYTNYAKGITKVLDPKSGITSKYGLKGNALGELGIYFNYKAGRLSGREKTRLQNIENHKSDYELSRDPELTEAMGHINKMDQSLVQESANQHKLTAQIDSLNAMQSSAGELRKLQSDLLSIKGEAPPQVFASIMQRAEKIGLQLEPGLTLESLAANRLKDIAANAFKQQAEALQATVSTDRQQSSFLSGVEKRRSLTTLSSAIGDNYEQVACKGIDDLGGFFAKLDGKLGKKNQIVIPNYVIADQQIDGVVKQMKNSLKLKDDVAFIWTDLKGEKKVIVGGNKFPLAKFSGDQQAKISQYVMLYDERTAAGGDYEKFSQNNKEDDSFRQFVLMNSKSTDSLKRNFKTDTLVQALGRIREGSRAGARDNVQSYLFGDQPSFQSTESSLFATLQAEQEQSYRESDIHEVANRLAGAVTNAYNAATGGKPKEEGLGVYAKVVSSLRGAADQKLSSLSSLSSEVLSGKPLHSVDSVIGLLGELGVEKQKLDRIQVGMQSRLSGTSTIAPSETQRADETKALSSFSELLQEAVYTNKTIERLSKNGSLLPNMSAA